MAPSRAQVSSIVAQLCPSFQLTYALANTSKYELPAGNVTLENIFARMLQARADGFPLFSLSPLSFMSLLLPWSQTLWEGICSDDEK